MATTKMRVPFLYSLLFFLPLTSGAQSLNLPQKSPAASVSYTIGLTEVTIRYSSPAVGDRTIWGDVVPYGEIWRAGANSATTIEFSSDVNLEGTILEAGRYAFFLIPRKGDAQWTAIFNKEPDQWGAYKYDEAKDALRVEIRPQFKTVNENRLAYSIHDQGVDKGYIRMSWEKARVYLRFKVDILEQALENVDNALERAKPEEKWVIYAQGASFLLDNEWQTRQAMEWADKSTSLHDHSWNWYVKARAQAASGDYTGAVNSAQRSIELGQSDPRDNFFKNSSREIERSLKTWNAR